LLHPAVEESPYSRLRAGDLERVGLGLEPREDLLSLIGVAVGALLGSLRRRCGDRDRLLEHDPLAGAQVETGGDAGLPRLAVAADTTAPTIVGGAALVAMKRKLASRVAAKIHLRPTETI
jgi:hypothetical protein